MLGNSTNEPLVISLSCHGRELYRLNTTDFTEEIVVGRSSSCTWSVGSEDSTVSSRHAVLSRRKRDFYITDLGSRNGMHLDGRRVKEVRLRPDMTLTIGECTLTVTRPGTRTSRFRPHILRYVNDRGRRVKYKVMPGTHLLGSGSKCALRLNSSLVSNPHASVVRKVDGSCWVRDMDSRNGTQVNHDELPAGTERMLKDGDVISLADVDVTYIDPAVHKEGFRLVTALTALAVTVALCFAGYATYMRFMPSAGEMLEQARVAARNGNFEKARQCMTAAATARSAQKVVNRRQLLASRLEQWEHHYQCMQRIRVALQEKNFGYANQLAGLMDLRNISGWDWNEATALETKKRAELYCRTFNAMSRLISLRNNSLGDMAEFAQCRDKLEELLAEVTTVAESDQSLTPLATVAKENLSAADAVLARLRQYEKLLEEARPGCTMEELRQSRAQLEKLRHKALPILASRVIDVLPIYDGLIQAEEELLRRRAMLWKLECAPLLKNRVEVPENATRQPRFDQLIADIVRRDNRLRETASRMSVYLNVLNRAGITPGVTNLPEALQAFQEAANLEALFACDTLKLPPVHRNREKPAGIYDRLVGVEFLHGLLSRLGERGAMDIRGELVLPDWNPAVESAANMVALMEHFVAMVPRDCPDAPQDSQLVHFAKTLQGFIGQRDAIVAEMLQRARKSAPDNRQRFIAYGVAACLNAQCLGEEERQQVRQEFATLRRKVLSLSREYDIALPKDAIALREQVLATGMPGDNTVKRMWSLR